MLTVLFATRNGALHLPMVLNAFAALTPPAGGWKLVAVDNASTDSTPDLLRDFAACLPLTVLREPARGKNRALNTGLRAVEGDLVILTDDDVLPAADWLVRWREAADHLVEFDVFGGTIRPRWPQPPPRWLLGSVDLGLAYAATAPDLVTGVVSPNRIWGGNMAVRRGVFEAGHRFHDGIGPQAGSYAMGSDTHFAWHLAASGYRCAFVAQPQVEHIVRLQQMSRRWLWARYIRAGRGAAMHDVSLGRLGGTRLFGVPRHLLGRLMRQAAQLVTGRMAMQLEFCATLGKVLQARKIKSGV